MHELVSLKEKLCHELEDYARRGRLDVQSVQIIDTIAHTIKNLNKILEKEEMESDYSEGPHMRGTYSYANQYSNGYNYNRRNNYSNASDWRNADYYSMNDRYSMSNNTMINRLRDVMADAPDEKTRNEIQNLINRLEMS